MSELTATELRLERTIDASAEEAYDAWTNPEVFAFDADRKVSVIDPAGAPGETILKAAASCPYRVISVIDDESGTQLFPPVRKPPAA